STDQSRSSFAERATSTPGPSTVSAWLAADKMVPVTAPGTVIGSQGRAPVQLESRRIVPYPTGPGSAPTALAGLLRAARADLALAAVVVIWVGTVLPLDTA